MNMNRRYIECDDDSGASLARLSTVRLSEVDNLRDGDGEHPDKKPDKRFPALRLSLRARREANAASRDRNNRRVYAVIMRHENR